MSNNTTELNLLTTTESELATKTNPLSTIIFGLTIEYDDRSLPLPNEAYKFS
jgi:hypothetical protein